MKTFILTFLVMLAAAAAFGQPDPRDSVILESKTVTPGTRGAADSSAYLYVKVYITNKDSLTYMALSLLEHSTSGRAYAILGWPRTFLGIVNPLGYSFRYGSALNTSNYHSNTPDSFLVGAGFDPASEPPSIEPPNAVRKAVWEIKFDSVWGFWGTFALDTVSNSSLAAGAAQFTNTVPQDMPVNFVKSTILVARPPPDPRDSVILESKTVTPGNGHPYTTVKVYLTNKDSLSALTLVLVERSTSGGAYATLPNPRTYNGVIRNLTPSLRYGSAAAFHYNSSSPDTFLVAALFDPTDRDNTLEPPNSVRKAVWEIKFDTVLNNLGTFELDSCTFFAQQVTFTNEEPRDMPANFLKSVISVVPPIPPTPDPRDSVILESETVMPGTGHPYTRVKVFITNKDTLTYFKLALQTISTSGGAYAILANPRTFDGVITPLVNTLKYLPTADFGDYHGDSPDSFFVSATYDPAYSSTFELPNTTRKAIWEIKFDTVLGSSGTIELDTITLGNYFTTFANKALQEMPVNFVKSTVTVSLFPKGDLNEDAALSPADVVWILNCVMLGPVPPAGTGACDLNCDGMGTAADVVLELNAVFLAPGFPC